MHISYLRDQKKRIVRRPRVECADVEPMGRHASDNAAGVGAIKRS
jgi:hypothetical protein